jgi:hypothetical protein
LRHGEAEVAGWSLEERGSAFHVRGWGVGEAFLVLHILMSLSIYEKKAFLAFLTRRLGSDWKEL